jgi:hypothetical protein
VHFHCPPIFSNRTNIRTGGSSAFTFLLYLLLDSTTERSEVVRDASNPALAAGGVVCAEVKSSICLLLTPSFSWVKNSSIAPQRHNRITVELLCQPSSAWTGPISLSHEEAQYAQQAAAMPGFLSQCINSPSSPSSSLFAFLQPFPLG